jgi:hypothetical protein
MDKPLLPKMNRRQAKLFWSSLTPKEKLEFNKMYAKLVQGKLKLNQIAIDDNELIQRITLEDKVRPSIPTAPFASSFKQDKE